MREHDWESTPLGSPRHWPDGLKTPLRMMLTSKFEMWLGWGDDLFFFYNDAYIPTLGLKHPSMLGKPFREVWAEVYADVADQVAQVRRGEATWNDSLLLLLERSGYREETYHSFSYSPLYGGGRDAEGLLCIVSEVTKQVITERRLGSLRMLGMELAGASTREGVCRAAAKVLASNRRDFPFALIFLEGHNGSGMRMAATADAEHLLDLDWPHPSNGATDVAMDLPEHLGCPPGHWDIAPRQGLVVHINGTMERPLQGRLVLGLNPYRRQDTDAADLARLMAAQISGALASVATLAAERRRADRIWSHSRDLLVTFGADGILRSVSPSWTRTLGQPTEGVVGRSFLEFVHPEDAEHTRDAFREAVSHGDVKAFENRLFTSESEVRWISWYFVTEDDVVFGYGRDISEKKENAQALRVAEEALRHAQKMEAVGQLTGGIAHDFNNLLTGISGSLDLIRRRRAQNPAADIEQYLAIATASADRAAALTQRLLAFSRRQALAPRSVDVERLVGDMGDLIRKSVGEMIRLHMAFPADLWRARCDPNQLENAILNLGINARDAMPAGGSISISGQNVTDSEAHARGHCLPESGEYVLIAVTDNGHGMAPNVVAKAFDPFFTTKPLGKGTGLGLSMIYGFAQQSGGAVHLESREGLGTSVFLYLPRSLEEAEAAAVVRPDRPLQRAGRAATVLVVEDEPGVRALIVEVLESLGYGVIEAQDGAKGLDAVRSVREIDLLVTDVGLPGLNGRQLADAARVLRPGLKVLFVTGYIHDAAAGARILDGGMELITKPFAMEKLAERVNALMQG